MLTYKGILDQEKYRIRLDVLAEGTGMSFIISYKPRVSLMD